MSVAMTEHDPEHEARYWTTDVVAGIFGVTERTVRKWAREGVLPAYRWKKMWLFEPDAIRAAVRASQPEPPSEGEP